MYVPFTRSAYNEYISNCACRRNFLKAITISASHANDLFLRAGTPKKIRQCPESSFLKHKGVKKQQKFVKLHADVI